MTGFSTGSTHRTASMRVVNSATCARAVPTQDVSSEQIVQKGSSWRGWASVGAIALGAFVIVMTETLPVGLLPQIADGLGVTLGPAGLIVLVPGFAAAVTAPLFYLGSSSLNRRGLILLLGLTVLVSNAIVALAPNFALVLIARMLFGATLGAYWTVVSPVGPRLVGKASGTRAISIIAAGISGGTVVGLPAGQFLGNLVGWRYTFAIAAAATLLIVIAQKIVLPSIPPPAQRTHLADLGRVISRPATRFGMAAGALAFIGQFTAWTYLTPFLTDHTQLSSGAISVLYVLYGVAGIVGSVIAGSLFNRGVVPSFAGAAIVVAVLVIALALTGTVPWSATVLLVLWGGFWGIVNPGTLVWILHSSPAAAQEAASAVNVTNLQIALALGSGLGAILVSSTTLPTLFGVSGVVILASGVLAAISTRFVRTDPPT
ncbi:MFS transporter [Paractinoplanes globisporus]|nr:MFS transporter [Actinoplanes globisporus]